MSIGLLPKFTFILEIEYSLGTWLINGLMMTEMVRCPSCRGSKKVAKLGGVIGECSTCTGSGSIKAADKPVNAVYVAAADVKEVMNAVDNVIEVKVNDVARTGASADVDDDNLAANQIISGVKEVRAKTIAEAKKEQAPQRRVVYQRKKTEGK